MTETFGNSVDDHSTVEDDGGEAGGGLVYHIAELRTRTLRVACAFGVSFLFSYVFAEEIFGWISAPLRELIRQEDGGEMIFTGLAEAFMTYMRLACYSAVCLTTPYALIQIYAFAVPGLYEHERGVARVALWGVPVCFFMGMGTAFYGVMPLVWRFFLGFENAETGMRLTPRVSEYLESAWQLLFAFGVAFQFPLILTSLVISQVISLESLRKGRKYMFIAALVFGAVLTPPDILSQLLLAGPVMICYELVLVLCGYVLKRRNARL